MNCAFLKPESPFAKIFPDLRVPIINILLPSQVTLEGSDETRVYMVDLKACSKDELSAIARLLASKSGDSPQVILREFMERGLPLRVSQTGCATDVPFFL